MEVQFKQLEFGVFRRRYSRSRVVVVVVVVVLSLIHI